MCARVSVYVTMCTHVELGMADVDVALCGMYYVCHTNTHTQEHTSIGCPKGKFSLHISHECDIHLVCWVCLGKSESPQTFFEADIMRG